MNRDLDRRHARNAAVFSWIAWASGTIAFLALYAWSWNWFL